MKYVLLTVVVFGMIYIGFGILKFYQKRKKFFEDLTLFCNKLCVDISFSKENLRTIINQNINNFGKDFKSILENYLFFLENNESVLSKEELFKKNSLIRDDEKEIVLHFFKDLGRLDASNQVLEIQNYHSRFESSKKQAEEENKKFGALSLKLMVLLGAVIVIILI